MAEEPPILPLLSLLIEIYRTRKKRNSSSFESATVNLEQAQGAGGLL